MPRDEPPAEKPRKPKCPICRKPPAGPYRPFCSKRCADVDLGRWVTGSYVIPGGDADSDEDGQENAAGIGQNVRTDD